MKHKVVMAGFAVFAMFFGSGNIVFPLLLGRDAGPAWPWALAGFFLTAIIVPQTGLVAMVLCQSRGTPFFQPIGKKLGFVVQLMLLSLLGPFGVVPRCISVSLGAFKSAIPLELDYIFIVAFATVIGLFSLRQDKVIAIIAKYLTPAKFLSLLLLIVLGSLLAPPLQENATLPVGQIFTTSVLSGYQTMDLMAGLFFATAIMGYLRRASKGASAQQLLRHGLMASAIGAGLLTIVYAGFMHLGAQFAPHLSQLPPETLLPTISKLAFGSAANYVFCGIIILSCMTTAVALTSCWIDFLTTHVTIIRVSHLPLLVVTLLVTVSLALFGFSSIVSFLGPLLEVIYPGLIALAIANIYKHAKTADVTVTSAAAITAAGRTTLIPEVETSSRH